MVTRAQERINSNEIERLVTIIPAAREGKRSRTQARTRFSLIGTKVSRANFLNDPTVALRHPGGTTKAYANTIR